MTTKQMTIGTKLKGTTAIILLMLFGLAGYALYAISTIDHELNTSVASMARKMEMSADMALLTDKLRTNVRGLIAYASVRDRARVDAESEQMDANAGRLMQLVEEFKPLLTTERGRQAIGAIDAELPSFFAAERHARDLSAAGNALAAVTVMREEASERAASIENRVETLKSLERELFAQAVTNGDRTAVTAKWIMWVLVFAAAMIATAAFRVVAGLTSDLRHTASELSSGADQIASVSGQVASASQSLANGSSQQAASLEETSASAEEIASITRKTPKTANLPRASWQTCTDRWKREMSR